MMLATSVVVVFYCWKLQTSGSGLGRGDRRHPKTMGPWKEKHMCEGNWTSVGLDWFTDSIYQTYLLRKWACLTYIIQPVIQWSPQEPCLVYDLDIVIAPKRRGLLLENYLKVHLKASEDWQVVGFIDFIVTSSMSPMDISWVVANAALTSHIAKDPDICLATQDFRVHLVQERGKMNHNDDNDLPDPDKELGSQLNLLRAIPQSADIVDPPYSSRFHHLHHWCRSRQLPSL